MIKIYYYKIVRVLPSVFYDELWRKRYYPRPLFREEAG
jgi:hypothetical protein